MKHNTMPKWQREIENFIGVKSCIILEGNVYDEYPRFSYSKEGVVFKDIGSLDSTIRNIVEKDKGRVVFCDPILGFYTYGGERQEELLSSILEADGVTYEKKERNNDGIIYFYPKHTNKCSSLIYMSEIIRNTVTNHSKTEEIPFVVFVVNFASRLEGFALGQAEANELFLNLVVASTSNGSPNKMKNTILMVVDKYNDIPAWVYLNNPNVRTVSIGVPDRNTRRIYLQNTFGELRRYSVLGDEHDEIGKRFVAETEGMQCSELGQILKMALKLDIPPEKIRDAFQLYKYGVKDNPWDQLEESFLIDLNGCLENRVKGQSDALDKVKIVIKRAVAGLSGLQHSSASQKPRGILFFAGPTGVGKTETAKAIAEAVFGDENACIRFDMSEYRQEHSDQKLFGAPPGYVGYEGGGQLTNAIKKRPFSVLLFDEIEKASPTILDKFLQIFEDGRMTDNQGNTVYFGESIIIFTSNIGLTKVVYDKYGRPVLDEAGEPLRVPVIEIKDPLIEDTYEFRAKVSETLTQGVKNYFTRMGRPELLNRLGEDNIVVFQFINVEDAKTICEFKLENICEELKKKKGIVVSVDNVIEELKSKAVSERANGGRGVGNMLEREFLNPLAEYLCDRTNESGYLECYLNENREIRFKG